MHPFLSRFDDPGALAPQQEMTRVPQQWNLTSRDGAAMGDAARQGLSREGTIENLSRAGFNEQQSHQATPLNQGLRPLHLQYLDDIQGYTEQSRQELLPGKARLRSVLAANDLNAGSATPDDLIKLTGMA